MSLRSFLKLPGAFSGVLIPKTLSSVPEGPSRPNANGQHYNGGLHQSSRGLTLLSITLAHRLMLYTCDCFLSVRATHVPGNVNSGADVLSRGMLMYSYNLCEARMSAHIWPHVLFNTCPPLALLPPTLSKIREHGNELILIPPHWLAMHWLVEIYSISYYERSRSSSHCVRTCCLGEGSICHPHPRRLLLWAWPLR